VLLREGVESPVLTHTELYEYAHNGFLNQESLVYDEATGVWARADSIPFVLSILRQTGRLYTPPAPTRMQESEPQVPKPHYQNYPPQQYGPQMQLQAPPQPYGQQSQFGHYAQPGIIQYRPGAYSQTGAIICAVLMTGLGQMINRQVAKGFVIILAAIVIGLLTLGVGAFVIWILALVDAITIANRLNRGEPVREWQCF
jgi:TM2 domain-containing membrane protein YozV